MASLLVPSMGFCFFLFLLLVSFRALLAQEFEAATIKVDGATTVAETDDNFICGTLDWWPHDKCHYNNCPWGYSSVINMVQILKNYFLSETLSTFPDFKLASAKKIKPYTILISVFWYFQDLSHPLLSKAIEGLYISINKLELPNTF